MRSVTKRFSSATQIRFFCKFGKKRRRVLLFACDTLFPYCTVLPVSWQTLDIAVCRLRAYFVSIHDADRDVYNVQKVSDF
jgi:hypothetical protein